ncbi:PemK-like protein [Desulfosarcina variabilis str. Montpellier]|uniref:type II toxin-antitoxin system PemK/MazF family toxin n=1 Tax=Desulfosarcina variabilis TaxID=2300 RepID=UPI003AFA92A1
MTIKRAEIHLAALDPTFGREIAKTRPIVIVSNDINNQYSGTVTVLPMRVRGRARPTNCN